MESAILSAVSDDREEGEIVDDDFEDISDNSITIPIYSGKSVSSIEHLPAISLSSVTEVDEPKTEEKVRRRQKSRKKNCRTYKKRRSSHRRSATFSDSDSDGYVELDRNQLKAAIRVDDVEERHKNSLRTRLKVMTNLDDSDHSAGKNEDNGNKIEHKESSDEGDTELTQLRLEALRTASDISIKTDTSETNKENHHDHNANENINVRVEETPPKKIVQKDLWKNVESKIEIADNMVIENNTPPEDDEDVLRALLLASMSKKITNETEPKKTIVPSVINNNTKQTWTNRLVKSDVSKFTVKNVMQFKNRVVKNVVVTKTQMSQLPQVKPLIINVNADSESDDDLFNKTQIEKNTPKCERAKVEAQLSPIEKPPPNLRRSTSAILEKSSVKLLPKVKQIEYHKLLQRLKNAEKRPRVRRLSSKTGETKTVSVASKKLVRTKVALNKQVNASQKVEQSADIRMEVKTLHKTLKEMQAPRNGRINDASVERKKCDEDVKRLFEELAAAKKRLVECQKNFSTHVRELIGRKEAIDKSSKDIKPSEKPKAHFTSTPIKGKPPLLESFEASSVPSTTPNQSIDPPKGTEVDKAVIVNPLAMDREEEIMDVPFNPGDPNDIDKIYCKQKSSLPKYISPLDKVKKVLTATDDPFSIVCPYDVDGNCRDPECVYRHLFK
ncbi:hypothetical protein NQ318_012204 [Aromia moschata]|uniref:Zinc-finger domain-containing protein n=1 Tax=Aromia moschata TaxID=1265417 RepID=A0AAV8YK29_9CUCU|nr:hypothetical protein NQ318_012204 [Aromia moschata]